MGHVGPDQHVADPQLVRTRRFEATEDVWLLRQSGAVQPTLLQVLADGALRHADAVARQQDGAELSGGPGRQFLPQLAGFLQQLGVAACNAQVSAWLRLESGQALLTIGSQPAIERTAGEMMQPAIRQLDRLAGELAHELPPFRRTQAWVGGLRDEFVSEQRRGFGGIDGWIGAHVHLQRSRQGDAPIQLRPGRFRQDADVLVANTWPALMRLQNRHTSARWSPKRARARASP